MTSSAFCAEQPERSADLVLAADVFVYLAALDAVFARDRLACWCRSGFFAFTVQAHGGEGVHLGADSRYAHSEGYLRATAERAGFSVAQFEAVSTRQDRGVDVPGFLMVLEQPGGSARTKA